MLNRVNRCGLSVKINKAWGFQQLAIGNPGALRQGLHSVINHFVGGLLRCEQLRPEASSEQPFQVGSSSGWSVVFLCDYFALFSHSDTTIEGALGQRFKETVCWASAAADSTATTVEKRDLDTVIFADVKQLTLSAF